ncbi:Tetraacyldisaccharide 4'-kinase [Marinomonas spartinae]|uniref:Tetraacyldisaccharide 4'-kinase n=1 Tax=Marinomonas spartinae TaxID=1792290 RepID=A0A1A8TMW6_9GAMM|nr:tetraacyldisaccharide 4'-kinase [Marinomonas spartinae]SBS34244.1 Tetraacyldisaccharide 4'-kinase [Marinomonas spartinae]SBS37629.1 Tetraacyldisaccharide 4'-kinase [Marinomonas spartinae]
MSLESLLTRSWYGEAKWTQLFLPLMPLVQRVVEKKRAAFLANPDLSYTAPVPVIVVGNITTGGTGKSPMVVALCEWLRSEGFKPGIVSRGHGAKLSAPTNVMESSLAQDVGDEPVMLARRTHCPMVVYSKRAEAVQCLLERFDVDVVISDDGMQHYALNRDIEIAMIDAKRGIGNGYLLPVGPLREPVERLASVDFIVSITEQLTAKLNSLPFPVMPAALQSDCLLSLDGSRSLSFDEAFVKGGRSWSVMAGIGNPERFLSTLGSLGLNKVDGVRWFADHYVYQADDIPKQGPVVMTEKDAVKCKTLSLVNNDLWFLPVKLALPAELKVQLLQKLNNIQK